MLQNNNANIRRMKARVRKLESAPSETTVRIEKDVKIFENLERNRIQFIFTEKPSDDIRTLLKRRGFRWSRTSSAWQRLLNGQGRAAAQWIIESL